MEHGLGHEVESWVDDEGLGGERGASLIVCLRFLPAGEKLGLACHQGSGRSAWPDRAAEAP
jgi:hypothetical protein